MLRYSAQKCQNEVYHAVLSPGESPGFAGTYHPFITSCKKPAFNRRSLFGRVKSLDLMAILPWSCSDLSISRESASFVEGSAITSISTNIENALQFCLKISLLRCLSIIVLRCPKISLSSCIIIIVLCCPKTIVLCKRTMMGVYAINLDRIIHQSHRVEMKGESMRKKAAKPK